MPRRNRNVRTKNLSRAAQAAGEVKRLKEKRH